VIPRVNYTERVETALERAPVTTLLGPRQCGKTTLARAIGSERGATHFDLESVPDQRRLENPELVLGSLEGLVVLDEIQRLPELFNALRVLVDRPGNRARFLVLGSASPDIVKNVSQTLAGRTEIVELTGFGLEEIGFAADRLWLRGGFPRSFLADSEQDSRAWREGFVRTFLERDVPELGIRIPAVAMRRFSTMLAHFHGQTLNASAIARSLGISDKTVRSYLDILTGAFMVRQLEPWHENLRKRQVKSPKIYFRDSGLLHGLLEIPDRHALLGHPRLGASWEGFALEQVVSAMGHPRVYFWSTHGGAELDLFFFQGGERLGMEFKFSEAPAVTKSMRVAMQDLDLSHLWIVHPGRKAYLADERITVIPLADAVRLVE